VVIGRGRLIAQTSVDDFITASTESLVRVSADDNGALAAGLDRAGIRWSPADRDALDVHDAVARDVGPNAAGAGLVLYELVQQRASLEEAFLLLTADAADYAAGDRAHLTGRTPAGTAVASPVHPTIAAGDPARR
jgi:ABC-2 type transport system ATP-binding protein